MNIADMMPEEIIRDICERMTDSIEKNEDYDVYTRVLKYAYKTDTVEEAEQKAVDETKQYLAEQMESYRDENGILYATKSIDRIFASPVRYPHWLFRKFPIGIFDFDNIQRCCLAHIIHCTNARSIGYMACSCAIEQSIRATVEEVDEALEELERRNLIKSYESPVEFTEGHTRNKIYYANVPLIHHLLKLYDCEVWS